jgi:hypothetical protein
MSFRKSLSALYTTEFLSHTFITDQHALRDNPLENLPFDSLYKFLVAAGLTITVASSGALLYEEKTIAMNKAEQAAKGDVQDTHLRLNSGRIEELKKSGASGAAVIQEVEQIMKDNDKWIGEMDISIVENAKIAAQEAVYNNRFWPLVGGAAGGGALLVSALALWFFKLQRHIDRQARRGRIPSA